MPKPLIQQLAERAKIRSELLTHGVLLGQGTMQRLLFELCAYLDDEQAAVVPERSALAELRTVPGATSANADAESDRQALAVYRSETRALADGEEGPFALANVRHIQAKLAASEARVQELTRELAKCDAQFSEQESVITRTNSELEALQEQLTRWQSRSDDFTRRLVASEQRVQELTGELAWEKAWDLHRKADMQAVVEAARPVVTWYESLDVDVATVGHEAVSELGARLSALDARVEIVGEREVPGSIGVGDTVLCNFDTLKALGKVVRVDNSAIPYLVECETTELVRRETWADDRHLKRIAAAPPASESAVGTTTASMGHCTELQCRPDCGHPAPASENK